MFVGSKGDEVEELIRRHESELREMEIKHQEALQQQQANYFQSLKEQQDIYNEALKEADGMLLILIGYYVLLYQSTIIRGVVEG